MLQIENLVVKTGESEILHGINLELDKGKTCAIFGPNGSGKSTLLKVIMGFSGYQVISGKIIYRGTDITSLPIDERARMGIGISYQNPPQVRGIKTRDIVKICGGEGVDICALAEELDFQKFLDRDINVGFSGGEMKRSELLQLFAQGPELILLDEPDSGVDLENIALIGDAINKILDREIKHYPGRSLKEVKEGRHHSGLLITHTGHILDYITADYGCVLVNGTMTCHQNPYDILECIRKVGYKECVRCIGN